MQYNMYFLENGLCLGEEDIHDSLPEMKPLVERSYQEVNIYQDMIRLDPDYDAYLRLEEADKTRLYVLRKDDQMVGYWLFFVGPNLHFKTQIYAVNDLMYVEPAYRGHHIPRCLNLIEQWLRQEGIAAVTYSLKAYRKDGRRLMELMGYDHHEEMYSKVLS